ncbi:hypothetical protein PQX77_015769 [Marasmius sp. AFHP31]|nr:hypothetical protein PQX77_015769 [Marasmius sp. AFHP31]
MEIVLQGASTTENGTGTRIKIVKTFHNATIYPNNNCPVTVVTFEPKAGGDRDITRLLWEELYRSFSVRRSPWLAQALGLVRSEMPTFIFHEELVNGSEFMSRYPKDGIVYDHLWYTHEVAMQALRADKTLMFPVSEFFKDWTFNPKTRSWHFDIASASIKEWEDDRVSFNPIPLPRGSQPQLTADDIATYFEKTFGDVLYLYASLGSMYMGYLSRYASHGVLTFGAVVRWAGRIAAHFPSTPSPELHFESQSRNITASYSTEVSSRVNMQIHNVRNACFNLYFSLRLALKERYQLRAAYLSQHPSDVNLFTHFIDEIGFSLVGNLSHTPSTTRRPAYLFVPPLRFECVNGMHCIRYPLPESLFYWASDPEGRHVIPENDWVRYGIPKLDVKTCIGSYWGHDEYEAVKQHLSSKKYGSNGKQYAVDHGYPELIYGNPHARRMEELSDWYGELEGLKEDQHFYSGTLPRFPFTFSLINAPSDLECTREKGPSITTPPVLVDYSFLADTAPRTPEDEGNFEAVRQTNDMDGSEKHQMLTELAGRRTMGETSISQRFTRASVCALRGPQGVTKLVASPKMAENNLAGQRTSRTADLTRSGLTPTRRSRMVDKITPVPNEVTNQHKLVSTGSQTVKSVRSPMHLAHQNAEKSIGLSKPRTESQATGSLGARRAVGIPQKPTPSRRLKPAGGMLTVPDETAKQREAERESKHQTGSVKCVSTKFNPQATRQV